MALPESELPDGDDRNDGDQADEQRGECGNADGDDGEQQSTDRFTKRIPHAYRFVATSAAAS